MKTLTVNEPSSDLKNLLAAARKDRVLLKHNGRPVALVIDVREKDEEQILI